MSDVRTAIKIMASFESGNKFFFFFFVWAELVVVVVCYKMHKNNRGQKHSTKYSNMKTENTAEKGGLWMLSIKTAGFFLYFPTYTANV